MKRYKAIAIFFILLVSTLAFAGGHFHEKSLGGIAINHGDTTTEKEVMNIYGKGCADKWYPYMYYRYYYFPKHHIYGSFTISAIKTVTGLKISQSDNGLAESVNNAQSKLKHGVCTAKRELKTYQTLKGLHLGDSVKVLFKLYGKPKPDDIQIKDGVETYWYSPVNTDDDPFMTVEVKNGAVISIEIHSAAD